MTSSVVKAGRGRPRKPIDIKRMRELIAEGKSRHEVAQILNVDWATVRNRLNEDAEAIEIHTGVMRRDEYAAVRRQLGLTNEWLAAILGVSYKTTYEWSSGHHAIPGPQALALRLLARHPEHVQRLRDAATPAYDAIRDERQDNQQRARERRKQQENSHERNQTARAA